MSLRLTAAEHLNVCNVFVRPVEVDAESGVSAQPRGFEETRRGAQQRLRAARETVGDARAGLGELSR